MSINDDKTLIAYEQYEIVFTHKFFDGKGNSFSVEEPIIVRCVLASFKDLPGTYLVKDMLRRLEVELMQRINGEANI